MTGKLVPTSNLKRSNMRPYLKLVLKQPAPWQQTLWLWKLCGRKSDDVTRNLKVALAALGIMKPPFPSFSFARFSRIIFLIFHFLGTTNRCFLQKKIIKSCRMPLPVRECLKCLGYLNWCLSCLQCKPWQQILPSTVTLKAVWSWE